MWNLDKNAGGLHVDLLSQIDANLAVKHLHVAATPNGPRAPEGTLGRSVCQIIQVALRCKSNNAITSVINQSDTFTTMIHTAMPCFAKLTLLIPSIVPGHLHGARYLEKIHVGDFSRTPDWASRHACDHVDQEGLRWA